MEQWVDRNLWMDGCDINTEFLQAGDEGRDLSGLEAEFERLKSIKQHDAEWLAAAGALIDKVEAAPTNTQSAAEPNDLLGIQSLRPAQPALPDFDETTWADRLHGGLLGRICGCMLGKPLEGWHLPDMKAMLTLTENWPMSDYCRPLTEQENATLRAQGHDKTFEDWHPITTLRGNIHGMVEDDDINYTTIGFAIVQKHGSKFTPLDVAHYWCENVPILHTCTAERVAYRNFVSNVLPPQSASRRNPYREWIGAQIRADYFGYANPGNPERAADWAWRDACISHTKNGIYGEMWVAAMLAAAFVLTDWTAIIRAGLAQIPAHSRLTNDVEKILSLHAAGATYEEAVQAVHTQWTETIGHHWCHTNSNAQIVAIGLLYGEDDYEKTISRAVMAAFDTDCNGATCGSLWGVVHGTSAIESKWTSPMEDTVRTGVAGYHVTKISTLAQDMLTAAMAAREGC